MYLSRLDWMFSHIYEKKLEYDEIVVLYKKKWLCNQFQETNSLSKIIHILFCHIFVFRLLSRIASLSALFNAKGLN